MRVLLVEDEVHKKEEISQCVRDTLGISPEVVDSVRNAVLSVMASDFDLIILDMALPTFSVDGEEKSKGHDQAQGGIEVLRALKSKTKAAKIIIVTQYPDFPIAGKKVKLKDAKQVISEKYGQAILGAILYRYKSKEVNQKLASILRIFK